MMTCSAVSLTSTSCGGVSWTDHKHWVTHIYLHGHSCSASCKRHLTLMDNKIHVSDTIDYHMHKCMKYNRTGSYLLFIDGLKLSVRERQPDSAQSCIASIVVWCKSFTLQTHLYVLFISTSGQVKGEMSGIYLGIEQYNNTTITCFNHFLPKHNHWFMFEFDSFINIILIILQEVFTHSQWI